MPTIDHLSKLFKALASKDLSAAARMATEIAADEEKKGHGTAAQLLRGSLVSNGANVLSDEESSTGQVGQSAFLLTALSRDSSHVSLEQVALRSEARRQFAEIIKEFEHQSEIEALGIHRRSKLIFHGPPGCGKSLAASSHWEDLSGTSFAAPLLAREAAFALSQLQRVCAQGARPYAVTVKAFLNLTATPPSAAGAAQTLGLPSLGRGVARSTRLAKPRVDTAVLMWQGVLEGPGDVARVTLPIPQRWYKSCEAPQLRLVVSWAPRPMRP
jgi:hypothetical protein